MAMHIEACLKRQMHHSILCTSGAQGICTHFLQLLTKPLNVGVSNRWTGICNEQWNGKWNRTVNAHSYSQGRRKPFRGRAAKSKRACVWLPSGQKIYSDKVRIPSENMITRIYVHGKSSGIDRSSSLREK